MTSYYIFSHNLNTECIWNFFSVSCTCIVLYCIVLYCIVLYDIDFY